MEPGQPHILSVIGCCHHLHTPLIKGFVFLALGQESGILDSATVADVFVSICFCGGTGGVSGLCCVHYCYRDVFVFGRIGL